MQKAEPTHDIFVRKSSKTLPLWNLYFRLPAENSTPLLHRARDIVMTCYLFLKNQWSNLFQEVVATQKFSPTGIMKLDI